MDPVKFSMYFDQGTLELESKEEKQVQYVKGQLEHRKIKKLHIPSDKKDWYIVMDKVKAYCIDNGPFQEVKADVQELKPVEPSTAQTNVTKAS